MKFEGKTLKALVNIYHLGGKDGLEVLRRLRNHQGFVTLNNKPTIQEFIDMIGELDLSGLTDKQLKGLKHIMIHFDVKDGTKAAQGFKSSHGATHEFFDIVKYFDEIAEIQEPVEIVEYFGVKLKRVYDYVLKDGWHVDKKAWSVDHIRKYLKASAKGDFLIPGEAVTGQLFRDLVAAGNGKKVRWSFDARSGELGVEEIKKIIRSGLLDNRKTIARAAGKSDFSEDALDLFADKVMSNFDIEISDF